jgi:conjugal transfer pilus assembly protein TraA
MFGLPALALAASGAPADPQAVLNGLNKTLLDWTSGSLATGLAITMLLMGTGMAVARNTPFPAVMGVAGAAFLTWGPSIIMSLAMPQGPAQVATNPVPRVSAPSAHASMPQAASGTVAFKALASTALGSAGQVRCGLSIGTVLSEGSARVLATNYCGYPPGACLDCWYRNSPEISLRET